MQPSQSTLFLRWLQSEHPEAPTGSKPRYAPACARCAGPAASRSSSQDPLTVIDVGHTPDGIRQSLASLMAIHGAARLDPRHRRVSRQEGGARSSARWRRPSIRSSARRRITRERMQTTSPPPRDMPIPAASVHVAASIEEAVRLSPGAGAWRNREEFMSPVDYSWRSNTRPSRGAAAPRIWIFSERGAQSVQVDGRPPSVHPKARIRHRPRERTS